MAVPTFTQAIIHPVQWTCSVCGAAVSDTGAHTAWHAGGVV